MPSSRARSMIAKLSGSLVCGPKFMVPRQRRLTRRPVRPRRTYSMGAVVARAEGLDTSPDRSEYYSRPIGRVQTAMKATAPAPEQSSRDKILDAAERLFAKRGYAGIG